VLQSGASPGDGEVLAGEPSAEEVRTSDAVRGPCPAASNVGAVPVSRHRSGDGSSCPARRDFTNVLGAGDVGPVPAQDASSPHIGLALSDDPQPGALKAEVEPADPREGGEDIHDRP